MAMGHSLQHIGKLYETQTTANVSHYKLRGKIDTLDNTVNALQAKVDRLTALIEKFLPKRKRKSSGKPKGQPWAIRPVNHFETCKVRYTLQVFFFYDKLNSLFGQNSIFLKVRQIIFSQPESRNPKNQLTSKFTRPGKLRSIGADCANDVSFNCGIRRQLFRAA